MKLSNNAIKFLMAQYRAIYKNAYFKGIASAVVLTSVMAAGAAQAKDLNATEFGKLAADSKITSTSADNKLAISGAASNSNKFTITVTAGADHKIDGDASNATAVEANKGTLIINAADGDKAKTKLTIAPNNTNKAMTISFDKIDLVTGTIAVSKNTDSTGTTIAANTINIGRDAAEGVTASAGADLTLDSGNTVGKAITTYGNGTTINLQKGGTIQFGGVANAAEGMALNADNLAVTEGKIVIGSGATSHADKAKISIVSGSVTKGTVSVGSGAELSFDVSGKKDAKGKDVAGTLLFGSGSTIDNQGTIKLTGNGTYALENGITLTNAATGAIAVSGTAAAKPTLSASAATIKSAVKAGKVTVQSGNLTITDETVNVADLSIGAAGAGKLSFAADGVLQGNNIIIDAETTDATNMTVKAAGKLTLGKTSGSEVDIGTFAALQAKDVEFISHDGSTAFKLKNSLGLSSTATSGSITGSVTVAKGGTINVTEGAYTASGNVSLNDGALKVTAADNKISSLTLEGELSVTVNSGTDVTVTGKGATLDLTKTTAVKGSSGSSGADWTVNSGSLKIKGDDLKTLISVSADSGSIFTVSNGGTLNVIAGDNGLELDAAKISGTGVDDMGLNLEGGNLKVTGSLTLSGTSADIGTGTIQADSLTFKANDAKVAAGKYIALSSLGAVKADGTTTTALSLSGSTVTLGSKDAPDAEGTLTSDIVVGSGTAATLNVTGGVWGDQSTKMTVDLATSKLQVGGFYAKDTDQAAGKPPVAATLKLDTLTGTAGTVTVAEGSSLVLKSLSNTGSTITIAEGASATTNKLTTSGATGKLNISGSMSVKGDSTVADKKGVDLASGNKTVVVTDKGFLEFGATAVGSMLNADGTDLGTSLNGFTAGSIDLQTGGTVKFGFDSGVTLDSTDLKKLRGVFGVADTALTAGVLDLGNATITGVTGEGGVVSEDGTVKWKDIKGFADVNSDVVNKDLADVIVTDVNEEVRGNFGSLQLAAGSTDEQIGISTSSSLSGADKNNGLFASDSTGKKVVGLNVKNGTLTLNDSGKVGKVTLNGSSVLKLNAGQTGSITVQGDVNGKAAELLVNTGTANVTGAANIGFLDSVKGSTLNAASLNASSATDENTINGNLNVTGDASFAGALKLSGTASVGTFTAKSTLDTAKGSSLKVTTGAFTADKNVDAQGTIEVTGSGSVATFKAEAELAADGNKFVDVNFDMDAAI
ncbi:hypothetical protein, partial [Anaerobiospirillum sp. NML120449]|uniref:beta strand repeat-containing protein n=1 Tax=Anaerobiospirillum sp. NML120449 TaxID=2932817 RepID=UPI001FF184E9